MRCFRNRFDVPRERPRKRDKGQEKGPSCPLSFLDVQ
jgi:hypothetical protein